MNRTTYLLATLLLAAGAVGCGADDTAAEEISPTGQPLADLCAGAPVELAEGIAQQTGCPFEHQASSVLRFGTPVEGVLVDGHGETILTVYASCDCWWIGVDSEDVLVIVENDAGELRQDGDYHTNVELSVLPGQLAPPFTLER